MSRRLKFLTSALTVQAFVARITGTTRSQMLPAGMVSTMSTRRSSVESNSADGAAATHMCVVRQLIRNVAPDAFRRSLAIGRNVAWPLDLVEVPMSTLGSLPWARRRESACADALWRIGWCIVAARLITHWRRLPSGKPSLFSLKTLPLVTYS